LNSSKEEKDKDAEILLT